MAAAGIEAKCSEMNSRKCAIPPLPARRFKGAKANQVPRGDRRSERVSRAALKVLAPTAQTNGLVVIRIFADPIRLVRMVNKIVS